MPKMLTREQAEHYRREGYVVVERLLEPDTLAPAPVRMPLPKAVHQGSLYENQRTLRSRYFATTDEPEPEPKSQMEPESESEHGAARERAAAAD